MLDHVNGVVLGVFVFLFLLVTVLGFAAARWRSADLDSLDEWGLGGRGFGTFIAWFLIGGDIYTAYTFIAVPATLYAGSVVGFFAVPYTIVVYPLIFVFLPRLWSVSHRHGYVTPADFVQGRYDSRPLALAIALTGILATMPYIALQLVGMQVVLQVMGIGTSSDNWFINDIPLFIAFGVLAAYTYSSGMRAPALIAFVKDTLIYVVILVAIFYIPHQVGGWSHVFSAASDSFTAFNAENADENERASRIEKMLALISEMKHVLEKHGTGEEWILVDIPQKDVAFTGSKKSDAVKLVDHDGRAQNLIDHRHSLLRHLNAYQNFIPAVYANEKAYRLLVKKKLV